ncbi:hypothetical protein [Lentisalinibacter orientalis]|uniref:hypothetical protein n=1 Tax=Lentisalinibacter orientalis TaxID=2992241 RepID=UPI00386DD858
MRALTAGPVLALLLIGSIAGGCATTERERVYEVDALCLVRVSHLSPPEQLPGDTAPVDVIVVDAHFHPAASGYFDDWLDETYRFRIRGRRLRAASCPKPVLAEGHSEAIGTRIADDYLEREVRLRILATYDLPRPFRGGRHVVRGLRITPEVERLLAEGWLYVAEPAPRLDEEQD